MEVTLYKRPNGRTEVIDITKIRAEDAAWFEANHIPVSMEDCGADTAVYADCGFKEGDEEDEAPDEIIVLASNRSCEDTMTALREKCVIALAGPRKRYLAETRSE